MMDAAERLRRPAWLRAYLLLTLLLFGVAIYLGLVGSPRDVTQGDLIRIMYAHVSVAWIGFVAVGLTALFGALYLWRGRRIDDVRAVASGEMGLFFAALTIIGGMTYSRPTLNTFWTWDAKLTLTAIMVALMVGYFIVRGLIDDPVRRGRVSAVVALVAAASLPFNYLAAEWFRTLHPAKSVALDGSGVTMDSTMLMVLLFNTVVAGMIYLGFMLERIRIGRVEAEVEEARLRPTASAAGGKEVVRV
jgi:heme exporter protein C